MDLGLTSPQAQWLSRGGSSMSMSAQGSDAGGADPAGSGLLDSPFKHRLCMPPRDVNFPHTLGKCSTRTVESFERVRPDCYASSQVCKNQNKLQGT